MAQYRKYNSAKGMTLLELSVVMTIITLLVGVVALRPFGSIRKKDVSEDVKQFADTMRLVAEHAVLTGKTYEVVLEITDCIYTVYETNPEKIKEKDEALARQSNGKAEQLEDDELLLEDDEESLFENLTMLISFIEQIEFADGTRQYSGELVMRATPTGWDKSVLFLTLDDENEFENFMRLDEGTARVVVSDFELFIPEPLKDIRL